MLAVLAKLLSPDSQTFALRMALFLLLALSAYIIAGGVRRWLRARRRGYQRTHRRPF